MSANLLAELDGFYQLAGTATSGQPIPDDDDFGDFETADLTPGCAGRPDTDGRVQSANFDPCSPATNVAAPITASRPRPFRMSSSDIIHGRVAQTERSSRSHAHRVSPNILFDADEDQKDVVEDEFGEFNEARPKENVNKPLNVSLHPIGPLAEAQTSSNELPSLIDLQSDLEQDRVSTHAKSGLDDFDAWEPVSASHTVPHAVSTLAPVAPAGDSALPGAPVPSNDKPITNRGIKDAPCVADPPSTELPVLLHDQQVGSQTPPTNIPPPAVLLPVFPRIFSTIQRLFIDQLPQEASERTQILRRPETVAFVADAVVVAIACAHVIAGRKNRWKRDTILAQSMRISQASGKGGMKLTGIDKSEDAREEREVSEVVRAWKSHVGRMRTIVAGLGGALKFPDISDTMPVRLATQREGALHAPKQCVVCGIRRNERVFRVDVDVQDSFGEWWVEHWGHRGCVRFWETYKDNLASR